MRSSLKNIESKIKNFIINNKFFYFFYKIIKISRKHRKDYYYGEYGEDVLVKNFFRKKNNGFYLDVGCYHPIRGSLTYFLHKKGWKGMNIDISKVSIDLFNISRPNDTNINCAASNKNAKINYHEVGPINQANFISKKNENTKKIINSFTIKYLLKKNKIKKINYLNIDCEGHDLNVLLGIDFKVTKPELITIEEDHYNIKKLLNDKIFKFLSKKNYILMSRYFMTSFYVKSSFYQKIENHFNTSFD